MATIPDAVRNALNDMHGRNARRHFVQAVYYMRHYAGALPECSTDTNEARATYNEWVIRNHAMQAGMYLRWSGGTMGDIDRWIAELVIAGIPEERQEAEHDCYARVVLPAALVGWRAGWVP